MTADGSIFIGEREGVIGWSPMVLLNIILSIILRQSMVTVNDEGAHMKKSSKRIKYIRYEKGTCLLRSANDCKVSNVIIHKWVLFKGKVIGIDNYAFRNRIRIKSVVIPEGVVSIGDYAFENCKNLERIVLPHTLKSIGRGAFMHCEKLKSIVLPETVTSISAETFACCYSLKNIDLSNIHTVGEYAFAKCDSLNNIAIGDALAEIYASSFQDSGYYIHRENWKDGLLYLGKWVAGCNGLLDEYIVKSNTIGIAADTFADEQHVKRTPNPMFNYLQEQLQIAMVCPQVPVPDLSDVPEYFEEIVPARIHYEGTSEEWNKIIKLRGEKRIPVFITTANGTIETSL